MKKSILIPTFASAIFATGTIVGIAIANNVEKNTLKASKNALTQVEEREFQLRQEIAMIQENLQLDNADLYKTASSKKSPIEVTSSLDNDSNLDNSWMTDSLKLSVMFMTNSAGLSDSDHKTIEALSDIMHQFPDLNLKLDGYTDPRGSIQENIELATRRVNAVKQAFESYSINTKRILTKAYGEMQGVSLKDSSDVFAMARKVNVYFTLEPIGSLAEKAPSVIKEPLTDKEAWQEIAQN